MRKEIMYLLLLAYLPLVCGGRFAGRATPWFLTKKELVEESSWAPSLETPDVQPSAGGLFGSSIKNESLPEETKNKEKQTNNNTPQQSKSTTETASSNKNSNSGNTTSSPNVIVVGGLPSQPGSYQVLRATPSRGQPPGMIRPYGPVSGTLTELFSVLVQQAAKLVWLVWLLRQFHENERILPVQRFAWERLNDRYTKDAAILKSVLQDPPFGVSKARWRWRNLRVLQKFDPPAKPLHETFKRTVIVVLLAGDKNGHLDQQYLKDVVSFLLHQHRERAFGVEKPDGKPLPVEVVLLVSSPGGSVTHYGLAAAQVRRLAQEKDMTLTVCVDRAAASGGYMIASQAHKLIAAPFAMVGSVGVVLEGFNFRELAQMYGVNPIVIKSGKHKNTLSTFGTISSADEKHEAERLTKVHEAFQELVVASRPDLVDQKKLLEGQVYMGSEALRLGLVDEVMTSDEYIMNRIAAGDRVLKLHQSSHPKHQGRLANLSPLDLLPHLQTWISTHTGSPEKVASLLLAVGPVVGFANHLIRQFMAFHGSYSSTQSDL